jgi:beta-glucuronidase
MNKLVFMFVLLLSSLILNAQSIQNVYGRESITLNGKWNYIIDPYETGYYDYRYQAYDKNSKPWGGFFLDQEPRDKTELIEYSFEKSPTLWVPGDWNSQDDKLLYYEGTIWYRRKFDYNSNKYSNQRVFLWFGAVNYEADVYLNGKKLGKHIGGFTPFEYEVSSLLKEKGNSLVVKVDNKRKKEGVPTLNTDWWNYGGITRDVKLLMLPKSYISDYQIQLKKGSIDEISGFIQVKGVELKEASVNIPELKLNVRVTLDENGKGTFSLKQKKIELWSPEVPKLYSVEIVYGEDRIADKIGFRTIETRGSDILLNGKSIFLRGICIHEENALRGGRAHSMQDARMLLQSAKDLNCNYVRLAHYPHSENMVRLADEMGILVWEEIPVYWTIQWENEETYQNAESQLSAVIQRDKNRASVIFWSMANETPVSEPRNRFLQRLAAHARSLDNTRLISAALEVHTDRADPLLKIVEDPFAEYVDIVNFNQYIGWYDGTPEKCDRVKWQIKYDKPVMISEFGGGAVQGFYADSLTRWSEEYLEDLYKRTLGMLDKIPQFRGVTPWILYDFRSPRRVLPNVQDGWNRKGVIGQNGEKKKAFFVLRDFYTMKESIL